MFFTLLGAALDELSDQPIDQDYKNCKAVNFNLTEELFFKPAFARKATVFEADFWDRVSFYFKLLKAKTTQNLLGLCYRPLPIFKSIGFAYLVGVWATIYEIILVNVSLLKDKVNEVERS